MATTLADIDTLANSAPFIGKVTAAVLYVGAGIIKTVIDAGTATGLDKARVKLAEDSLADPVTYGQRFARILAVQPSITDASSDAAITNMVQAVWTYLSRVNL